MFLYLVQHAKPKLEEEDPKRSLSEEGWSDVHKVGAVAKNMKIHVEKILHSGKTRAQQTAETLAEYLVPAKGIAESDGLKPLDDPSIWANRLTTVNEDIMLVGHLPHLNKLSEQLLSKDEENIIVNFQMGAIVCLEKSENNAWSIHWIITPQMLV